MKLSDISQLRSQLVYSGDPQRYQQALQALVYEQTDNLYQELEMNSRFADTHRDSSRPGAKLQLHSHTFYEILYCTNTCGAEYLLGSERYRLQRGDIVIVPPGISHRPILPETMTEPYQRDVLWISTELLTVLNRFYAKEPFDHLSQGRLLRTAGSKWESLGLLFRQGVMETERQDFGWEVSVLGNSVQLLVLLQRMILDLNTPLKAEQPELLDQVIAYIEEHLDGNLTLVDTSAHFFVSESTITHSFRKKMGVSFHHYVTQRRLIAAKTLIQQGHSLESIGEQVGFSDYSSFYRAFKKEFGISPRQYRKLHLSSETPPIL